MAITIVAAGLLLLLSMAWLELTRVVHHKIEAQVAKAEKRLGEPIVIGRMLLQPGGARFEDVRIGDGAPIVISRLVADVGLNPFASGFGELASITIERIRIKTGAERLRDKMQTLAASDNSTSSLATRAQRSVEKFFQALPVDRLAIESAGVTILGQGDKPLLQVKGLRLLLQKKPNRLLFRVASVQSQGVFGLMPGHDEEVQGRFELMPRRSDYRFFVRRKILTGGNLWAVSGIVTRDLSHLQVTADLHGLPSFLEQLAQEHLGEDTNLKLRFKLEALRDAETWHFSTRVQSLGTRVTVPFVSTKPLGPLYFDGSAKGSLDVENKVLVVDNASLVLPLRQAGHYPRAPLRFTASLNAQLFAPQASLTDEPPLEPGFAATGHLDLAQTPCQLVLDSAPTGLLASVTEFKLEGDVQADLSFDVNSRKPDDAKVDLSNGHFGCHVLEAPYAFSAEHLSGPFVVQREVGKDDAPRQLSVDPLTAGFTPLEQVAKNVDLALVTSEDAGFYAHKGIDAAALAGALRKNLAARRIAVGGSTITMQTVKNLFLTPERTVGRKIQELFLAWHLESILEKQRILEIYMNIVEFGPGIYGITDASRHFFDKRPIDLTLAESAYLAALLPSPKTRYRYFCDGKVSPNFHDLMGNLLKRMLHYNRITYDRYAQAASANLQFNDAVRQTSVECAQQHQNTDDDEGSL